MAKKIVTARQESGNIRRESQVQTIATLSSSIVHELKNYLATIHVRAELSERELVAIKKTVNAADYLIGNLLLQVRGIAEGKPSNESFKKYFIVKNIEEILERYPFKTGERELVTVEVGKDFEYVGNTSLTMHVFYNLIRNSLRAINEADKGEITMKFRKSKSREFNELIFRDTGPGIKKEFLSKIFALFETRNIEQGGEGIGLAYCKEIMKSYGGDITCDSVEGEYTEFVLKFPVVNSK